MKCVQTLSIISIKRHFKYNSVRPIVFMFLLYILYIREIWKNLDERGFKPTTFALGMHESNQPICHIKQIQHEAQPTIRIPLFQIFA